MARIRCGCGNRDKQQCPQKDGPAIVNYYENGKVEKEIYFLNSKWHREDGPVFIWYDENGNIEEENYFLNDRKCDVLQEMAMRELNNLYQNSEPFTNRREISNKKIIQEEPIQEEIENKNVIKTKKRKIFIMENF